MSSSQNVTMRHRRGHAVWTCSIDVCTTCKCRVDMKHAHVARTCRKDMHGHEEWTWSVDLQHAHAAWKCSMDIQHRKQNGHAEWTSSKEKQQRHAAGTCIHLTQDPCFSPCRGDLDSWTGFPEGCSKGRKRRFFSFALSAFALFALDFLLAPALFFYVALAYMKARKITGARLCEPDIFKVICEMLISVLFCTDWLLKQCNQMFV